MTTPYQAARDRMTARINKWKKNHPPPTPPPTDPPPPTVDLDTWRTLGFIPFFSNVPAGIASVPLGAGVVGAGDYPLVPVGESVEDYMPNVGGREDLSKPLTCTSVRASLLGASSHAWLQDQYNAAAHSRFPIHYTTTNGSPHNMDTEPFVTLDSRYPGRVLSDTTAASFPGTVDTAHHPQLCYFQYLVSATGAEKERWLHAIQHQAQFGCLLYGTSNGLGTFQKSASEVRSEAHLLMNLGLGVVATTHWETLGITPAVPLLSANYLRRKLTNELLRLKQIMKLSNDPFMQYFRMYPNDGIYFWGAEQYAVWMADMVTITLGWLARMGFTVAKEIFDFCVVAVKARYDTGLGWRHVYKVQLMPNPGDPIVATWAEMYASAIVDPGFDVGDMMHAIFCLDASMGGDGAARALAIRTAGFSFWQIGYFFDPTVRAIPMTQAVVSPDAQFKTFQVTELPDSGVDSMGREYITENPNQPIWLSPIPHDSTQMAIIHTADDYVWFLYNGINRFKGNFLLYFGDGWHYNVATRMMVAP